MGKRKEDVQEVMGGWRGVVAADEMRVFWDVCVHLD